MAIAFQIICAVLIVSAAVYFVNKSKKANVKATKGWNALYLHEE